LHCIVSQHSRHLSGVDEDDQNDNDDVVSTPVTRLQLGPARYDAGISGTRWRPGADVEFGRGPSSLLSGGGAYLTTVYTDDDNDRTTGDSAYYAHRLSPLTHDSTDFTPPLRPGTAGLGAERIYQNLFGRRLSSLLTGRHVEFLTSSVDRREIETNPAGRGGAWGGAGAEAEGGARSRDGDTGHSGSVLGLLRNWRRRQASRLHAEPGVNNLHGNEIEALLPVWLRDVHVPTSQS